MRQVFGAFGLTVVSKAHGCTSAAVGIRLSLARGWIVTVQEAHVHCCKRETDAVHVRNRSACQSSDIDFATDCHTLSPDMVRIRQTVANADG